MSKKKITAVLMGGPSEEREVSLASGVAVVRGLREAGREVEGVDVPRSLDFDLPPGTTSVFLVLHGTYGEDGTVQRWLEEKGVPYTGADAEASALAFDKHRSKAALRQAGIPTPDWRMVQHGQLESPLPFPVVVKPPRQGSSVGLYICQDQSEWQRAVNSGTPGEEVMVEAYVPGRELTVGVVGEEVLPIVEIRAPGGLYDYQAKYTKGMTEYLVPAPLPSSVADQAQSMALEAYRTLGCRHLGRVDFRLTGEGRLYVLELNTLPGFTETSLLPKAAAAAGITFSTLCERILELAENHG